MVGNGKIGRVRSEGKKYARLSFHARGRFAFYRLFKKGINEETLIRGNKYYVISWLTYIVWSIT